MERREKRIEGSLWKNLLRDFHVCCSGCFLSVSFFFLSPQTVFIFLSPCCCIQRSFSNRGEIFTEILEGTVFKCRDGISEGVKLKRRLGRSNRPTNPRKPNLFSLLRSQSDHHFEPRFSINLESLRLFELKQRREFGQRLEIFLLARNLLEIFFLSITSNPLNLKLHIVNEHLLFYIISSSLFEF